MSPTQEPTPSNAPVPNPTSIYPTPTSSTSPSEPVVSPRPTPVQSSDMGYDVVSKKQRFGSPRAYLVEYLLSLALTGVVIGLSISFLNSIIQPSDNSSWSAGYAYTGSLVSLSTMMVALPALLIMSKRCRNAEREGSVKGSHWRKGLLAIFLVLVSLNAVGAAIAFVYSVVSHVMSFGLTDSSTSSSLKSIGVSLFATLLLTFTAVLYAQDYRSGKMPLLVERAHRYGLAALALLLTILFIAIPLQNQRNAFSDRIKSNDITSLQREIRDYESDNDTLPDTLDQLSVKDSLRKRLSDYEYIKASRSYELCTDFKTDTRDSNTSGNPLEAALGASFDDYYQSRSTDPSRHDKGRQCFEYTSTSSRSSSRDDLFEDFDFDLDTGSDESDSFEFDSTLN